MKQHEELLKAEQFSIKISIRPFNLPCLRASLNLAFRYDSTDFSVHPIISSIDMVGEVMEVEGLTLARVGSVKEDTIKLRCMFSGDNLNFQKFHLVSYEFLKVVLICLAFERVHRIVPSFVDISFPVLVFGGMISILVSNRSTVRLENT